MLTNHNMHARGIRSRYLKDLFVQYRGAVAAYDEGFARGDDAVLAAALWRNVFAAREEVDYRHLATVVSYIRRVLAALDGMEDEVVVGGGLRFGDPGVEGDVVEVRSRGLDEPFGEEDSERENGKKPVKELEGGQATTS
jgi:cytochrome b pre-mRNA-processing protein 3